MANEIALSQLKQKREEIQRSITLLEAQLRDLRNDVSTITDALSIFGEETGEPRAYPQRTYLFQSGELSRIIYEALRDAPDGLDTVEIAEIVMRERKISASDKRSLTRVKRSVNNAMHRYAEDGRVLPGELRNKVRVWRRANPSDLIKVDPLF